MNIRDLSLADYLPVKEKYSVWVPHTAGRYQKKRFRKAQCPLIERLVNSLMYHGRNTGKKLYVAARTRTHTQANWHACVYASCLCARLLANGRERACVHAMLCHSVCSCVARYLQLCVHVCRMAIRIVQHTFELLHLTTGKNPLQIFVDAVQNGGPREDSTRIGSSGVVRRQAVDVSPLRRVNQAIYMMTVGARESAFRNIKSIAECLADEINNCANDSQNSYAIKKKDEIERVATANR